MLVTTFNGKTPDDRLTKRGNAMSTDDRLNALGVRSREYKLILASDRFQDRRNGVIALRSVIGVLLQNSDCTIEDQGTEEMRRTYYVDTPQFDMRSQGFALRVRFERDEQKKYKIALKHRTPDRYIAASKGLHSTKEKSVMKFEEDILPPFRSIYSQSNSCRTKTVPKLKRFGDAVKLFPGLGTLKVNEDVKIGRVNEFEVQEVFHKLCKIRFGDHPSVKLGLSFWYQKIDDHWPLIAEFAFDYSSDHGDLFPIPVVEETNRFFRSLYRQPGWFNLDATTKTRYAYQMFAR